MDTQYNMAILKFGYSSQVVMPIENAIKLLKQFSKAESIDDADYSNLKVIEFKEDIQVRVISNKEYMKMKTEQFMDEVADE